VTNLFFFFIFIEQFDTRGSAITEELHIRSSIWIWVRGHSRSLKLVLFDTLHVVPISILEHTHSWPCWCSSLVDISAQLYNTHWTVSESQYSSQ